MRYDEGKTREERLKTVPIELDKMSDAALRYRPKNKLKSLKPRKRRKVKS
jgi:hypothetical protein